MFRNSLKKLKCVQQLLGHVFFVIGGYFVWRAIQMYSGGDDIQSRDLILDILFFYKLFTGAVQLLHPVVAIQSSTYLEVGEVEFTEVNNEITTKC